MRRPFTGAGIYRHARGPSFIDGDLDDSQHLFGRQCGTLARRPARHQEMDAGVDLAAAQTPHGWLIEIPATRERGNKRGTGSRKWRSHGMAQFCNPICNLKSPICNFIYPGRPAS